VERIKIDSVTGVYTDLFVRFNNLGNIPVDSINYKILVEGVISDSGVEYIYLEPATTIEKNYRLLDSTIFDKESGVYDYQFEIMLSDSILSNNLLKGRLFWIITAKEDQINNSYFKIYPNPALDGFYIHFFEKPGKDIVFYMYSSKGQLLEEFLMPAGEQSKFISVNAPPGIYFLKSQGINAAIKIIMK
jgi:hypothetical protein